MKILAIILCLACLPLTAQDATRPRARDIGVVVGILPTGAMNAITDIPGVAVGHKTIAILKKYNVIP